MNKQIYTILSQYLEGRNIPVDRTKLKYLLQSHPESNSLNSVSDTLNELHIKHIILYSLNTDDLISNGFPVIVQTNEGSFLIVEYITRDRIDYYEAGTGIRSMPLNLFNRKWTGIALYIEENNSPGERQSAPDKIPAWVPDLRIPLLILSAVACAGVWCLSVNWSPKLAWLLFFNIAGLVASILLTIHEWGEANSFIHKVCHLNRKTNCNKVLQSPAAKLFGWIPMSDIGLCYFSGSIIAIMLSGIARQTDQVISWLFVFSLCALPYTLFSLWYQAYKVEKWCSLCLAVIVALWAENILSVIYWHQITLFPVSALTLFILSFGFLLPTCIWIFINPVRKEYSRIRKYERRYLRIKNAPHVIRALLEKEQRRDMNFSSDEIHLGAINAPLHLTVVVSLHCRPCRREWETLNELYALSPGSIRFTLRFAGYGNTNLSMDQQIDSLTGIYKQYGPESFCEALTYWFECEDYLKWKDRYPGKVSESAKKISKRNMRWIQNLPVTYTPTIFIDGRILPAEYQLAELKHFISEIN